MHSSALATRPAAPPRPTRRGAVSVRAAAPAATTTSLNTKKSEEVRARRGRQGRRKGERGGELCASPRALRRLPPRPDP